jgi:hypothetical protein
LLQRGGFEGRFECRKLVEQRSLQWLASLRHGCFDDRPHCLLGVLNQLAPLAAESNTAHPAVSGD